MGTTAKSLERCFKPHFAQPGTERNFEDVLLMSADNAVFPTQSCILASCSPIGRECLQISDKGGLESPKDGSTYYIFTELESKELEKFHSFLSNGYLIGYQSKEELLQDKDLLDAFSVFGMDLALLNFQPDMRKRPSKTGIHTGKEAKEKLQKLEPFQDDFHLASSSVTQDEEFLEEKDLLVDSFVDVKSECLEYDELDNYDYQTTDLAKGIDNPLCSAFCKLNCSTLSEEDKSLAYESYNCLKKESEQNIWFAKYCQRDEIGQKSKRQDRRKNKTTGKRTRVLYFLPTTEGVAQVCYKFFCTVLSLQPKIGNRICRVIQRVKDNGTYTNKRGSYLRTKHAIKTAKVVEHILSYTNVGRIPRSDSDSRLSYLDPRTGLVKAPKGQITQTEWEKYRNLNAKAMYNDYLSKFPTKDDWVCYTKYYDIVRKKVQKFNEKTGMFFLSGDN